jgi:hypothetical protein
MDWTIAQYLQSQELKATLIPGQLAPLKKSGYFNFDQSTSEPTLAKIQELILEPQQLTLPGLESGQAALPTDATGMSVITEAQTDLS